MAAFSRRKALAGGALAALAGLTTAAVADDPNPDAALLALCAEFDEHSETIDLWEDGEVGQEEGDAAGVKWWAVLGLIVDTPARTMAGIQAKARVLHRVVPDVSDNPEVDGKLGMSLAADLMRLGAVA